MATWLAVGAAALALAALACMAGARILKAVGGPPLGEELKGLARATWRGARRLVIAVTGATVLLAGVAMIFLPGPAVVVIPMGLAILAGEFAWARWLLRRAKRAVSDALTSLHDSSDNGRP